MLSAFSILKRASREVRKKSRPPAAVSGGGRPPYRVLPEGSRRQIIDHPFASEHRTTIDLHHVSLLLGGGPGPNHPDVVPERAEPLVPRRFDVYGFTAGWRTRRRLTLRVPPNKKSGGESALRRELRQVAE